MLDHDEPTNYEEAMVNPDSAKWLEAMKSKMRSMYENKVWTLVDLLDDRQAIENKWIFKKKTGADGNVTVYKARLVAKGFRQVQGVDYNMTFSRVAMLNSVRIMLAIAAFYDYEIWQMDKQNYIPILEKVQLPHQVLLSSHSLLSRETPSLERIHY